MIKLVSKLFSFTITFINIFFFYFWAAVFYLFTAISALLSKVPILNSLSSVVEMIYEVLSKIIGYIWYLFDYIILIIRDVVVPFFLKHSPVLKKIFLWILKPFLALFRLIFPKCKSKKRFCTKFESKISSNIALIIPEDRINENRIYENSLRDFYQNEINNMVREKSKNITPSQPLLGIDALYEKCKTHPVSENIDAYNRQLNALQVSELNIVLNYNLTIRQHRLALFRDGCRDEFKTHKKLLLYANQRSFINDKVLI